MIHSRLSTYWDSGVTYKIRVQLELLVLAHSAVRTTDILRTSHTLRASRTHLERVEWLVSSVDSDSVAHKVRRQQSALVEIASSLRSNVLICA